MKIYLAHGASGNAASMSDHVRGLEQRGLSTAAVGLPVGLAEKALPAYERQVDDIGAAIIGGQSFGGRVASMLAADKTARGLVLLSYPLHRPGQPDWQVRTAHWPSISCPVLLLSGDADPFARIELLRMAVERLDQAELVTYPRLGHGLRGQLPDVLDRIAAFAARLG